MLYDINWAVTITTDTKNYSLQTLTSISIETSVDNLVDTCVIELPEAYMNSPIDVINQVKRGSLVEVKLGYNQQMKTEFIGYVTEVKQQDNSLKIYCEDALFLFKKSVKNVVLSTDIKGIAQHLVNEIDTTYKVVCSYGVVYEKFVINQATGYDVLKKISDETKANIYFLTDKKELHIHEPYTEKGGDVAYNFHINVEKSSLEYKLAIDKKYEITIESTDTKGKVKSYTTGTTGGDKVTLKVGSVSEDSLKQIAEAALKRRSANAYEGSIDTWLIPYVEPTYTAHIVDEDYPERSGKYYVSSVNTTIDEGGAKRKVKLGIRI